MREGFNVSAGVALAIWLLVSGAACADSDYPNRPIRLIVPFAPGGGTSVVARLVGQKLTETWKQQVIIDNRPGGNSIIGTEALVKATPDGYTLLLVTSTHAINPHLAKTSYDAVSDFSPVSTLSQSPYLLVVHPSLPVRTLKDFIAFAKSRPGQLDYAASGSANHLATELLSLRAGIKMHHIPYKGGGPAITDLLGGQVQVHLNVAVNLIPNIKSGRLRGLAVAGESRLASLPDLPTFGEAGLPAFSAGNWSGLLAPANTPRSIVQKLALEVARVLQGAEVREKLAAQGQFPWGSAPAQFAALIRSDIGTFGKVIEAARIKTP